MGTIEISGMDLFPACLERRDSGRSCLVVCHRDLGVDNVDWVVL